jgi:hypothetical protein
MTKKNPPDLTSEDLPDDEDNTPDVILKIGELAVKDFKLIFYEKTKELDQDAKRLLWFSTIHYLLLDVFVNMPDRNPNEPADRLDLFETLVDLVREDLIATLKLRMH